MINCAQDRLTFAFPDVQAALAALAARHVETWLPKITAPDPAPLLAAALNRSDWLDAKQRAGILEQTGPITRERVADKYREMVAACLARHRPGVVINFQRTLRLPDDGKTYPLPPGLGAFPLRPIQRYQSQVPPEWSRRGGVLMPIYQAEALWLNFSGNYPVALKVGTGLVNAANGQPWSAGLCRQPQGYLVLPEQPWLDGYCAGPGIIRQFVAARLGRGYTAEEQLHGTSAGGLQLEAIPLKPERYFEKELCDELQLTTEDVVREFFSGASMHDARLSFCMCEESAGMGLGAGGTMKQETYADPWEPGDWQVASPLRVWVHLCDAIRWHSITGEPPPQKPFTARDYTQAGLPWFDYYRDDMTAIEGSPLLAKLKSVFAAASEQDDDSVPQEDSVDVDHVKAIGPHAPANTVGGWDGK